MATVSKKPTSPAPASKKVRELGKDEPLILRAFDGLFRFLASLKLAVISISALAGVLAFGTFYETWYGTHAVQVDIYQSKGFALLLAFLGINIFCAALIRFPWTKRQTGFVITHAGLLVVLLGSFLSLKMTDSGQVGLVEGDSSDRYVRIDDSVMRIQKVDPGDGQVTRQFLVPFAPGAFPWESQKLEAQARNPQYVLGRYILRGVLGLLAAALAIGGLVFSIRHREWVSRPVGAIAMTVVASLVLALGAYTIFVPIGPRHQTLTQPNDPFRLVVKDFLPSSTEPRPVYEPSRDGVPMLRTALLVQPPGEARGRDAFQGRGWVVASSEQLGHGTLEAGPAKISFQYLSGPNAEMALDDFLHPPKDPLKDRLARFHYRDRQGNPRVYDWLIEDSQRMKVENGKVVAAGKSVTLPDSELTATLVGVLPMPTVNHELLGGLDERLIRLLADMGRATESPMVHAAVFKVRKGDGPEISHIGWSDLPLAPNVTPFGHGETEPQAELLRIGYFHPPELSTDSVMSGRFGVIEVVATPEKTFYYRAFGRDGLKGIGPIDLGKPIRIFGGDKMPMQISLRVDDMLPSGKSRLVCEPLELPREQRDEAVPAALVEMTVDGESKEFWLRRTLTLEPQYEDLTFRGGHYRISYDYDSRPLPFEVHLLDFDPSNDPGTTARSAFRSDVTVRELDAPEMKPVPFNDLAVGQYFHFLDRPRETFKKLGKESYEPFDGGERLALAETGTVVQPTMKPVKITMNNPMVRDNWTFYQTSYKPVFDERREPTGTFVSYLSVRYDPAWPVVYGGCLLVVIGTFVQFYMRAGVFTDGGKREQARNEARARKKAAKTGQSLGSNSTSSDNGAGNGAEAARKAAVTDLDL